jgi:hypothetical protein
MTPSLILLLTLHAEPLHRQIDSLLAAPGKKASPLADDGEFLRRASLDLAGTLPTSRAARAFLTSREADKRRKLIDGLLASPEHPRRMASLFHVQLMERLGDDDAWLTFLHDAFAKRRPWDEAARDILTAQAGASFWLVKRLENYGQNPVDYPGLARDVGRLFLGKDLRCAQCHDHLFIDDYKQADFQGLFAFVQPAYLNGKEVRERLVTARTEFTSVFGTKGRQQTGPRVPGGKEVMVPAFEKGKEWLTPPDPRKRIPGVPRFSPLAEMAREVTASPLFARNLANRLWWAMMGRGLIHPLDLDHTGNPPSHPELLGLLARHLAESKFDVRSLIREIALTDAYQRSSRLPEGGKHDPAGFRTMLEKRLSAEQMLAATLEATGMREAVEASRPATPEKGKRPPTALESARLKFRRAFAGPPREPEDDLAPELRGALFWLNDPLIQEWLSGPMALRVSKLSEAEAAEELYLSVLTRFPDKDEAEAVRKALAGKEGKARLAVVRKVAWALLASTEFNVNH